MFKPVRIEDTYLIERKMLSVEKGVPELFFLDLYINPLSPVASLLQLLDRVWFLASKDYIIVVRDRLVQLDLKKRQNIDAEIVEEGVSNEEIDCFSVGVSSNKLSRIINNRFPGRRHEMTPTVRTKSIASLGP
jgi:hypothetical protein